jgi:hypothetical protein
MGEKIEMDLETLWVVDRIHLDQVENQQWAFVDMVLD